MIYYRLDSMNKNMKNMNQKMGFMNKNIQKIMLRFSTSNSNSDSLKDSLEKGFSINASYKRGKRKKI